MGSELLLHPDEKAELVRYLKGLYRGVFSDEAIHAHVENHIGLAFAEYAAQVVRPRLQAGASVLDVGSGFGSVVLAARDAGLDAFGVEIASFEVEFARKRLRASRPGDDPEKVYLLGDARELAPADASLDAVTLWNVIEHISDWQSVIAAVARFLKPGGLVFIICPNYMAWRQEAHYHVPWRPAFLMPRSKASEYLRSLGKNPRYFETSIFYRTNWEVLGLLRRLGFDVMELGTFAPRTLRPGNLGALLRHPVAFAKFYNPFRHSVEIAARKRSGV